MFSPELRRNVNWHSRRQCYSDHLRIHTFCVHVNLHAPARLDHPFEHCSPKAIIAFSDAALPMNTEGYTLDRRTLSQQRAERVAAISCMVLGCEAFDAVVGVRAVGPTISVSPNSELEMQPA